jgi:hypothetical protein
MSDKEPQVEIKEGYQPPKTHIPSEKEDKGYTPPLSTKLPSPPTEKR